MCLAERPRLCEVSRSKLITPSITVTHWPPRIARSPSSRHSTRPPRRLAWKAVKLSRPEPLRPEGRQRGMGRAGDRILVDPAGGDEDPADDVAVAVARRGGDGHTVASAASARDVGRERAHRRFVGEQDDASPRSRLGRMPAASRRRRRRSQRGDDVAQRLRASGVQARQRRADSRRRRALTSSMPALRVRKRIRSRLADQDMAAGQRRVAAQRHLDRRREPAQLVIRLAVRAGR